MKTFLTLLKREFNLFWNNKVLRILFIGAPILYGILIGYVYEKGQGNRFTNNCGGFRSNRHGAIKQFKCSKKTKL